MNRKYLAAASICFLALTAQAQKFTVTSPSGLIKTDIQNGPGLTYTISMAGKTILLPSPLGFAFRDEPPMNGNFETAEVRDSVVDETWEPVVKAKHARIRNNYHQLALSLVESSGLRRKMVVTFRVFDDGVAFRYLLYRSEHIGARAITRELTQFRLGGNPTAWVVEYNKHGYASSQESEFVPRPLSYVKDSTIAGLPFLIRLDKTTYAAITEARIDNYPGFYLGAGQDAKPGEFDLVTKLAPLPGENEQGVKARFADTLSTPWRVIMLASHPGKMIESEIVQNLNDPCALPDASWIKPGISAWDHWWSGGVKMDMPTIKQYIDLASAQGWPYMLIDWQWYGPFNKPEADITKPAPQLNMPEILRYAKEKNVRCWVWLYSSDVNRNNNFESAFALYEKWGLAGIKIDFMDRDDQEMVNWYHDIIKAAARHHLMVDFHGAYKPDGIIRTYPNMITREGVMGEEYSKFSNRITPEHNVTLAYTRMLAGQMDYTPGGFLNVTKEQFRQQEPTEVMNTRCAELAKFVIYESPFTVFCDAPDHIINQPGADFLKRMPTTWDDIKFLSGDPGAFVTIVKRSGNGFYIASMNNSTDRQIKVPLDFLPPGKFNMETWSDGKDAGIHPTSLAKSSMIVTSTTVLTVKMAVGGGFVARLTPIL